jgi:hypothetical protein
MPYYKDINPAYHTPMITGLKIKIKIKNINKKLQNNKNKN